MPIIRTLAEAISHYGREAYLLTVAKDGPHTKKRDDRASPRLHRLHRGGFRRQAHRAPAPRVVILAAYRAGRLCLDRQWHGCERAPADGRDDGGDHTHEIGVAPSRS